MDEMKLIDLPMLSDEEYNKVVYDFNNTAVDYPRDKCVHELFEEQVQRTPDKTAVIACDKTLTYSELNEQANRIAHGLIEKGVKPGDIVAFMLSRKSYLIATMFGILKAGAAHMPIDPDYPQDRVKYMLNDSNAVFFVTEDNISELLDNSKYENPNISMSSDSLYCILPTSGSTGMPKLSSLIHSSLINFLFANSAFWADIENVVSTTIVTFDAFVMDTVLSVCKGKPIIFASEDQIFILSEFEKLFTHSDKNMLFSTPTKISNYIRSSKNNFLKSVKSLVIGGEVFTNELKELIVANSCKDICVFNIYGPTETTICITTAGVTPPPRIIRRNINQRLECPLAS